MFSMTFELTSLCNRNCIHCLRDKLEPRKSIPLDLAQRILKEAKDLGADRINITGGEASLYPDLEEFIATVVDYGLRLNIVTNGYRFRERMLPLLAQTKIKKNLEIVCFSLDGARASSHDAIRGEGSFKEVIEAATLCRLKEIPLGFSSIISNFNKHEITEIALLGSTLGAKVHSFISLYPTPRLIQEAVMPSPKELEKNFRILENLAKSLKIKIAIKGASLRPSVLFYCEAFNTITVDCQGNMVFCCGLSHITDDGKPSTLGRERIVDLKEISLKAGIARHFDLLAELMKERLDDAHRLNSVTHNPCHWCLKRFGKLDWLKNNPESPWAVGVIE
jgi:MoaA/NifB/PqqE/SkfB family radical SAM enzyme